MKIVKTYLEFLNEVMSQQDNQIFKVWDTADKNKGSRIKITFKDGETTLYMTVELIKAPYGTNHFKDVKLIETTSTEWKNSVNNNICLQDIPNLSGNAFRVGLPNTAPKVYTFINLESVTTTPATNPPATNPPATNPPATNTPPTNTPPTK